MYFSMYFQTTMADPVIEGIEAKKEDHKRVFEEYIRNLDSTNNTILSDKDFDNIVKFVNGEHSKWAQSKSLGQ